MKTLLLLISFLITLPNHCRADQNQWKSLKKGLIPKKKKAKHIIKEHESRFDSIKEKTQKEFEERKKKLIKKNKQTLIEKLQKTKVQGLAKDKKENQDYLKSLQSQGKADIKFWLKTQRYLKQIQDYLIHL